ncbi:MAG: leucyl aminopeptidase [Phycisphaerales bacterium]|jgi:leucyl aminopeptidase
MITSVTVSTRGNASTLVLGQFKGKKLDKASARMSGPAVKAVARPEATGELGSLVQAFPEGKAKYKRVIVLGLGEKETFGPGRLRAAAAALARLADRAKITSVQVELDGAMGSLKQTVNEESAGSAFGEGLGLSTWNYTTLRGTATTLPKASKLSVRATDRDFTAGLSRGLGLAESAAVARDLSQTPPNIATTTYIANLCQEMAKAHTNLKCTVIKGDALKKEGMEGLINVGKASESPPCLIRIEYTPATKSDAKPAVLVGKTMTYDSGGLSIKVGGGMRGMKRDKDGGCAVLGAMHAIATVIQPNHRVVALLACAENAISDEAYRPDDVITFRNGVTVEVTNTDAEGRLVLADALCWACDKEDPAFIVDVATLTGGVVVALGSTYAGMWCDNDHLRARFDNAANTSGEKVWRLPHHPEYRDLMKSPIADILNSAPVREAHPIQGAAFLSYFVTEGIPWCHLDIAGVHASDKQTALMGPGPTGFGTRLLAELLGQTCCE